MADPRARYIEPLRVRAIRAAVEGVPCPTLDDPEVRARFLAAAQDLFQTHGYCAFAAAFALVVLETPMDHITDPDDEGIKADGIPIYFHEGKSSAMIVGHFEGKFAGDYEHAAIDSLADLGRALLDPAALIPPAKNPA